MEVGTGPWSMPRGFAGTVVLFVVAFLVAAMPAGAGQSEPDPTLTLKLFSKVASKNGDIIVELRGDTDVVHEPAEAWILNRKTGKRTFLAMPATYITNAAISDDARYIVLEYHISSGGYGEAFERGKNGNYRNLADNEFAANEIKAGHVAGLQSNDLIRIHEGHCVDFDLSLAGSPARLIFDMGNLRVTYSLQQRRFTSWERSLLTSTFYEGDRNLSFDIVEMSGRRGMALLSKEWRTQTYEDVLRHTLVSFAMPKKLPDVEGATTEFQLISTESGAVKLHARKMPAAPDEKDDEWKVEMSGSGAEFEALVKALTAKQAIFAASEENKARWPAPATFMTSSW